MTELTPFERRLAAGIDAYVGPRRSVDAITIASAASAGRQASWRAVTQLPAIPRRLVVIGAAILLGALLAAALFGGGRPPTAARSVITFGSGGDIYVADPTTGESRAVVSGPDIDSSPVFSPDASLIAFLRGNRWTADARIVVVRRDGSAARVVVPQGFSDRGIGFAWTPDSRSLVVNYDSHPFTTPFYDGQLARFDVAGGAAQILTPPLPISPGTGYFGTEWVEVAGMFKPPNADRILAPAAGTTDAGGPVGPTINPPLYVWDADLRAHSELHPVGLSSQPYLFGPPSWSPDGSMIATGIGDFSSSFGSFVMNIAGTDVRPVSADHGPLVWSPDSSQVAFQRCSHDPQHPGVVLVVFDVVAGGEVVLEPTEVETKEEGFVPPPNGTPTAYCGGYTNPSGRNWDYEGWSWTPDSQGLVWLETHGEQPKVVDVESGAVTELPWQADSPVSWRAVADGTR
jgi:hypothetical protein